MGELLGHQLQPREIAALAFAAGWTGALELATAVSVCLAESQGYDHAINVNPDGSRDRGLYQLNDVHKDITDEIAYDPQRATWQAYKLYKARGGFQDWAAYTSGVYLHDSYQGRACVGVCNFLHEALHGEPVPDWAGKPYVHHLAVPLADFRWRVATLNEAALTAERAHDLIAVRAVLGTARTAIKKTLPA